MLSAHVEERAVGRDAAITVFGEDGCSVVAVVLRWSVPGHQRSSAGRAALITAAAGLSIVACSGSGGDGSSLVTDGTRHGSSPAIAGSLTVTLPEDPAEPWCLLDGGALVVWPRGSTYDVAAGEVRDGSGRLLGKVGESVEGGGMVDEPPSSDTLDDVDGAGCTPTDPVLHQYG